MTLLTVINLESIMILGLATGFITMLTMNNITESQALPVWDSVCFSLNSGVTETRDL
ncbi:hypothetical protein [Desulfosporosinus sp. FKB]|uniref:hypothetical protein n=1 Tax=Desulfosporosinus sp. FKB TaxID=1969835 RepID=UPI0014837723|nr:hypothetical protein [Desulfosporosinus sp. FKB]